MNRGQLYAVAALLAVVLVGGASALRLWRARQRAAVAVAGVSPVADLSRWPSGLRTRVSQESAAVAGAADPAAALADLARLYCANGFGREALLALGALRSLEPKDPLWPYLKADQEVRTGMRQEAEGDLRASLALDPGYAPGWLKLGELLREDGSAAEARECFDRALAADPGSARAAFDLAAAQARPGGAPPKGLVELARAHPEIKEVHVLEADCLDAASDPAGAARERRLAAACELDLPTGDPRLDALDSLCFDSNRMMVRAIELRREGRMPEVERLLKRVEELAPGEPANPLGWDLLSNFYLKTGRPAEARATLETAVADFPDEPQMRILLAKLLCDLQQPAEAAEVARRAIERWPRSGELHAALGRAHRDAGDGASGERELREALRLDPTQTEAQYDLGTCLLLLGDRAGAHAAFAKALAMRADFPEALFAIGKIELEAGDTAGAQVHVERLYALQPENPGARQLMAAWHLERARVAEQDGDLSEAGRQLDAAGAAAPEMTRVLREQGSLQARRGDWAGAAETLGRYVKAEPADPEGYLDLGSALQRSGRADEAAAVFRRGLEAAQRAGDEPAAAELQRRLGPAQ